VARIASEAIVERLADWGVDTSFLDSSAKAMAKWREQMVLGFPEHGVRYPPPVADYSAFARSNGGLGIKVERAVDVQGAISQALAHDGPALVDVNVNPDEPPLPGKVEYKQAVKFAEAFLRGQPRKATIASTQFKNKIEQLKA
jgi:pyruvate dehydrogenase (quinone)/pyruvate oxidase